MSIGRKHIAAFALTGLALAYPALAQMEAPPSLPAPTVLPAPPAVQGGPMVVPPPATPGTVPELSPARPCTQKDAEGLWKLIQVYEEPAGPESAVFYSMPSQYIKLKPDSTFEQYDTERDVPMKISALEALMKEGTKTLQQYVMQVGGQLYFYRDGVAIKQQACFIVAESNSYFGAGQMLFMPPNTQSPTRWVKVYSRVWRATDAPPAATPKPPVAEQDRPASVASPLDPGPDPQLLRAKKRKKQTNLYGQ